MVRSAGASRFLFMNVPMHILSGDLIHPRNSGNICYRKSFVNGVLMTFRQAEKKDLEDIFKILALSFDRTYAFFARRSFMGLENAVVAVLDDKITGAINYRIFEAKGKKIGYLFYLAVHPGHRKKGIGEGLVNQAIMSIEREVGKTDILTAVEKDNPLPRDLIAKVGFKPVSRQELKKRYGAGAVALFFRMNLMPWEEAFLFSLK